MGINLQQSGGGGGSAYSGTPNQVVATDPSGASNSPVAVRALVGADLPVPTTSTFGGVKDIATVAHKVINAITNGVAQLVQLAFSDISGSVTGSQLPTPSSSVLGGVKSLVAVAHNFLTSIGTDGVPVAAQPAFTDISGTATSAQGGVAQVSTAGQGITSVPACDPSYGQLLNNTTVAISTSGVVEGFQFVLPFQILVSKILMDISATTSGAGTKVFFGIYNAAGTTLLVEGVFDATSATVQSLTPTAGAVTLNPGVYWWVYAGDATASGVTCRNALVISTGFSNSMNKSTLRICKAGNAVAAGHLPATLGTLAANIANCGFGFVEP